MIVAILGMLLQACCAWQGAAACMQHSCVAKTCSATLHVACIEHGPLSGPPLSVLCGREHQGAPDGSDPPLPPRRAGKGRWSAACRQHARHGPCPSSMRGLVRGAPPHRHAVLHGAAERTLPTFGSAAARLPCAAAPALLPADQQRQMGLDEVRGTRAGQGAHVCLRAAAGRFALIFFRPSTFPPAPAPPTPPSPGVGDPV